MTSRSSSLLKAISASLQSVSGAILAAMPRLIRLTDANQFTAIQVLTDPGAIGGPKVIPNAVEVTLVYGLPSGKFGHNVLIASYNGAFAFGPADANAILTGLTTGAQWTALAAFFSSDMNLGAVTLRDLNTRDQPVIESTVTGAPGTSASPALPNEVSLVVTLRTPFTGPQNRGRMFVPGWATNSLGSGNTAAAAAVTALANWAGIISGVLSARGMSWGVGHVARQAYTGSTGTEHPARPAGVVPIQSVAVRDNHWDTNRRRGLK